MRENEVAEQILVLHFMFPQSLIFRIINKEIGAYTLGNQRSLVWTLDKKPENPIGVPCLDKRLSKPFIAHYPYRDQNYLPC